MKFKSLLVLAIVATAAGAKERPSDLEQVINQARMDGGVIVQCTGGLCYNRDTFAPLSDSAYDGQPDGVYIDMPNPRDDNYKLLNEASRIVQETKVSGDGH